MYFCVKIWLGYFTVCTSFSFSFLRWNLHKFRRNLDGNVWVVWSKLPRQSLKNLDMVIKLERSKLGYIYMNLFKFGYVWVVFKLICLNFHLHLKKIDKRQMAIVIDLFTYILFMSLFSFRIDVYGFFFF